MLGMQKLCGPKQNDTKISVLMSPLLIEWTSLVAQTAKCLSTMRETWVRSLDREDSLEKETATHSSILA